ncbi:FK506 binding protein [Aureococcus anophagefferens]|nr:FK506 binding protein [Aureococcus anophagefferens]
MKKGEVGHVTASVGSFTKGGSTGVANLPEGDAKAVAKIKLVLHSWRDNEKLTDCGTQLDGVTVHFLNLELGLGKEDGADPEAEQKWEPVENFAPFTVDWTIDETDAAEKDLSDAQNAQKAGLNVSLHNNRAQCYIIQEEWQKGKGDCDRALEGDPTNVKALFRRGHCCFHLDDWFEAKKNFKRCLELDPKCREAHKGLAIKSDKPDIAPKPDPDEAVDAAENGQEDGDKDGCVEPAAGGKLKIAAAAAALLAGGALCAWFFLKDE